MSERANIKTLVIRPAEAALKTGDVTECIISNILATGQVDVVGVGEAMFLVCSALNLSCEIAKIYLNQITLDTLDDPVLGKTSALFAHLSQEQIADTEKQALEEDKAMDNIGERTISVGHEIPIEKLITRSLMALARFEEIKLIAAGNSINDAVSLAQKLASGQISREPVGVKLVYLYSINMRNDPAKRISAISIYMQKGISEKTAELMKILHQKILAKEKG